MITNIHRNCLGTVSFDGKFGVMRKPQDFILYPTGPGGSTDRLTIQSATRIGYINTENGDVQLTPSRAGGAYFCHLMLCQLVGRLPTEELFLLKAQVMDSASGRAGTNGVVYTDNSGALEVFG
jgi:hypothetical protein